MAQPTIVRNLKLKGREILSSYASFTLEGEITAQVQRGSDSWSMVERNGIAKGTSDGDAEAIYIPNNEAIKSMHENIAPLLPKEIVITSPQDVFDAVANFDLKLVEKAGPNKKKWGGNACLASSTTLFQLLMKAAGYEAWQMKAPKNMKKFYFPNIAFNMVCGGEHVPGTKQDIQEMFFFSMKDKSVKDVFKTGTSFFRQFEKNLVRDGKPTGTAKERGFVFPVADNFEGLSRIKECAGQLGLKINEWACGTDNAFSEIQKTDQLRNEGKYDMRFSGQGIKTREQLIDFDWSIVKTSPNFVTMEDPGSEHDIEAHRLMTGKYGDKVQVVCDDAAVTQMRFIIPFLASPDRNKRAGNSILIKLNQAGTFTETCLASEIVLGVADTARVEKFLGARGDLDYVMGQLQELGIHSLQEALDNIKNGGFSTFFSHRSTEGSSEFLAYMPLIYGAVSNKLWFKAGAPNGERNLQNYNPLIRAEEKMIEMGVMPEVANWNGLPTEVKIDLS
ncbi:MAG: hypothetical protein A2504_14415 [Bdellovibrionales bacterium RIFOXYD12_FULL_39_22]|nr:MAG: hypothetical protein A2385_04850 [Bdellovibrionales bacterium RIFOXYB1_FULL_39_21]OFZ43475.1 MAG: hypothetical protein A2485_13365 [Bdellovibrionales bacterium RIFOXYC12_FULL_39_17]OFZ47018.1 MAG: hypothetical protein A2404_00425 [Bdellovibrionales bacterium RIFOXYC1_FULL_39_130]OFZ76215.1 MAG: hypothetical protein A2560_07675 [Bdellovibrionales bacterium RIFOXYD1_FULL_39_84]OFZ94450.1 MAG: hypothetical protein A2504_14415 [Bdellovibrionales bacterium RIFOXYD12_FULL_39_22]HLE10508.1 hy